MKNILLLIITLFVCSATVSAQSDSIYIDKNVLTTVYTTHKKQLSLKMLGKILKNDQIAYNSFLKGKTNHDAAAILSFAGGFLVGYDIGRALSSGEPINPAVIGTGAAFICIAIPISISARKHLNKAVRTYNETLRKTSAHGFEHDMHLSFTGNTIGLRVSL